MRTLILFGRLAPICPWPNLTNLTFLKNFLRFQNHFYNQQAASVYSSDKNTPHEFPKWQAPTLVALPLILLSSLPRTPPTPSSCCPLLTCAASDKTVSCSSSSSHIVRHLTTLFLDLRSFLIIRSFLRCHN